VREQTGATEFLGYDTETAEGVVSAIVAEGGKMLDTARTGEKVSVIVNQTPFYGESGGQTGDRGVMKTADGARVTITDTQKRFGDLFVIRRGERWRISRGDAVEMEVDHSRRPATAFTTPRRTWCTRRCARCWAITWCRRARSSSRAVCGLTLPTPRPCRTMS
jgi:alanyl-tRNA synthetase